MELFNLPTEKIISTTTGDVKGVPVLVRAAISQLLTMYFDMKTGNKVFDLKDFINNINWDPKSKERLYNRIYKFCKSHKECPEFPSYLEYAIKHFIDLSRKGVNEEKEKQHYFDIATKVNWNSGDFSDHGSCYWSCRKEARDVISKSSRVYAFRLFKPHPGGHWHKGYRGIGRSWLYIGTMSKNKIPYPYIVMFNAYGPNIREQSCILANHLGKTTNGSIATKEINANNLGSTGGTMYINNGKAMLISSPKIHDMINTFVMNLTSNQDGTSTLSNQEKAKKQAKLIKELNKG